MLNLLLSTWEFFDFAWSLIILILLIVIIVGSIYLITNKYVSIIRFRLQKRRNKPWYSSEIPEQLLKNIDPRESIVFKSEKIKHRKQVRFVQIEVFLAVFGFMTALGFLFLTLERIMFIASFFIAAFIAPLAMRSFARDHKKDSYFLLTDKKIYLYIYHYKSKSTHVEKHDYFSIIGVLFKKRFYDKKGDYGTACFITSHSIPGKISVKNIPDFERSQLLIESILYVYGNIKGKWAELTNRLNDVFPREYSISEKRLKANRKSIRGFIIIILVMIIASLILYFVLDIMFASEIWQIKLIITIAIIAFNIIMEIIFLMEIILKIKRSMNKSVKLTIDANKIETRYGNTTKALRFDRMFTYNFFKTKNPLSPPRTAKDNYDFFKFYEAPSSKFALKFGPLDEFPELLKLVSTYSITWKADNGFLCGKEFLNNLDVNLSKPVLDELQIEKTKKELSRKEVIESLDHSIPRHDIDYYQYIQEQLDQDDYVIQITKPKIKLRSYVIKLVVGICCFLITVIFFLFLFLPVPSLVYLIFHPILLIFVPIATFVGAMFLCFLNSIYLSVIKKLKHTTYFLTKEKVIIKTPEKIIPLSINNMNTVEKKNHRDNTYNIKIILRQPNPNIEGMLKFITDLAGIPSESKFYDALLFLKEHEAIESAQPSEKGSKTYRKKEAQPEVDPKIYLKDLQRAFLPILVIVIFISIPTSLFSINSDLWWLGLIFLPTGLGIYIYLKIKVRKKKKEEVNKVQSKPISKQGVYCANCGRFIGKDPRNCPNCGNLHNS